MGLDGLKRKKRFSTALVKKEAEFKKSNQESSRAWQFFVIFGALIGIVALFSLGFWGAVVAQKFVAKTDILKLFKNGKYLILFQNNAEMRPSGGFIGSFAIVTFNDYKIENINFNTNIYKMDNAFTAEHTVTPPKPLNHIGFGKWAMRDSNFAVNFPEAAQKVEWFYYQESGEQVDGVIAINASVLQDLLKLTGPMTLPEYNNLTIDYDNFFKELAQQIEKDYFVDTANWEVNEPKTILKDMLPKVLDQALAHSKVEVLKLVYRELQEKHILLYSHDTVVQTAILSRNWGGQIKDAPADYLNVNHANLTDNTEEPQAGAKTSLNVKESLDYQVNEKNGQMVANLTITRTHFGGYDWPDGVNRNWTRVLVPDGSILASADIDGKNITSQVETSREAGKTTFGFYTRVAPQTSSIVVLNYILPFNDSNYEILVQKQPGNLGDDLRVSFNDRILFDGVLKEDREIK